MKRDLRFLVLLVGAAVALVFLVRILALPWPPDPSRSPRRIGRVEQPEGRSKVSHKLESIPAAKSLRRSFVRLGFTDPGAFTAGYRLHGLQLTTAGLALSHRANARDEETGELDSPPLPLKSRDDIEMPQDSYVVPAGCSLEVQMQLSDDGDVWSPWYVVRRNDSTIGVNSPYETTVGRRLDSSFSKWAKVRIKLRARGLLSPVIMQLALSEN